MPASARNDDSGSSGHALLDHASRELPGERHAVPGPDELRPLGERFQHALADGGIPQLLRRGLNHVAAPWVEFGSVTFFRRGLDLAPEVARPRPGLSVLQASLGDVALVLEASDPRRTAEIVRERLERGDLCFLALDTAGRPIHSGWATRLGARVPELERDIALKPYEAYLYDAFTPLARRGHGAFGFVLDHLFVKLQSLGARVVYSYVRSDDPKGQRSACCATAADRDPGSSPAERPCPADLRRIGQRLAHLRQAHDRRPRPATAVSALGAAAVLLTSGRRS